MAQEVLQTGPATYGDGAQAQARGGRLGETSVSELRGRYFEQSYRGNIWTASSQAVTTTTVGLATTYTGLVLSNAPGSGVNVSILFASLMQSVIQATQIEAYALAVGFNASTAVTHTTAVTPLSNLVGSGLTARALADRAATLPTAPTYHTFLTNTNTATANSTNGLWDLGGSIILPPGGYCAFVTPGQASVAGLWFSFTWEESSL